MAKKTYNLKINGLNIPVDSDLDDLMIDTIERTVNQKMQEISSNTDNPGTSKTAILAALDIEIERQILENDHIALTSAVDKKTDELISLIDGALE